jgi:hypothetical protein
MFENQLWQFVSECVVWKRLVTIHDSIWRLALQWLDDVMIGWEQRTQYQWCTLTHFETSQWRQETFHDSTNDWWLNVCPSYGAGWSGYMIYNTHYVWNDYHHAILMQHSYLATGKQKINFRRLVGTTLLKGDDEDMSYLKGETCLT